MSFNALLTDGYHADIHWEDDDYYTYDNNDSIDTTNTEVSFTNTDISCMEHNQDHQPTSTGVHDIDPSDVQKALPLFLDSAIVDTLMSASHIVLLHRLPPHHFLIALCWCLLLPIFRTPHKCHCSKSF
eukprot:11526395-Ditylum_brightwellii.AAC.1